MGGKINTMFSGVLTVRVAMFPLVIKAQRNAAKMTNNMPQLQVLQQKMTEARQSGNALEGNY
jgi:YidC/Oxa1 family membrane protein insertase